MQNKITGAGIIPVLDNKSGKYHDLKKDILYLVLVDNQDKYDFPKGCIDHGEYAFDCALRETKEECNLSKVDFFKFNSENPDESFMCGDGLLLFLGFVDNISNIKIIENPKTLYKEHKLFLWLTYEEILDSQKLHKFLIPAILNAHKIVIQ